MEKISGLCSVVSLYKDCEKRDVFKPTLEELKLKVFQYKLYELKLIGLWTGLDSSCDVA